MTKFSNLFNMAKEPKQTKREKRLNKFKKTKNKSVLLRNIFKDLLNKELVRNFKLEQDKILLESEAKITDYSSLEVLIKTLKNKNVFDDETSEDCDKSCKLENNNSELGRFIKATTKEIIQKYQNKIFENVNKIVNSQQFFYNNACEKIKIAHMRAYYRYIKKAIRNEID